MKFNIEKTEKYSFATIIPKNSQTVSILISIDIHAGRSVTTQATELMYSDALLSGTEKYTRAEFLHAVNLLGATISVGVNDGIVTYSLKSRTEVFSKLLKLFENMLLAPVFEKKEIKRIRATVANELTQSKEDARSIAQVELQNSFYGFNDRKYSFPIDETIEEVNYIAQTHLNNLHSNVLSQTWCCSVAASKSDAELLKRTIARIKSKVIATELVAIHQQKPPKPGVVLKQIPSKTNIEFSIGAPLPIALHHTDYVSLNFVIGILGKPGSFAGRLMSTVREIDGLTYTIFSRLEGFSGAEQGYWRVMTFFAPDKALQGLSSTFREVTKIYRKGISQAELEKFKVIMKTQQVLLNDSIGSLLEDLHAYHCHGFSLKEREEHKEKVNELTLDQVNSVIKKYLNPADLTVSGAGPTKAVQKEITNFVNTVR